MHNVYRRYTEKRLETLDRHRLLLEPAETNEPIRLLGRLLSVCPTRLTHVGSTRSCWLFEEGEGSWISERWFNIRFFFYLDADNKLLQVSFIFWFEEFAPIPLQCNRFLVIILICRWVGRGARRGRKLEKFGWLKNGKQECQCHTSNTRHTMAIVVAKQFYLRRVRTVWNGCKSIALYATTLWKLWWSNELAIYAIVERAVYF